MTEQNETPKKKRGRPPWTEEQKAAFKETLAKKREQKAIEERRAETNYQAIKRRKKGVRYRDGKTGPWSPEMRASNKATWDEKFAERDKEYKQLIADNPHKTKQELGIPMAWKPRDGSPTGYYGVRLRQARVGIDLPPININNPHEVEQRIGEYFDFCEINDKPPNMIGIANWLGVNRGTLQSWKDGDYSKMTPIIQRAVAVIEESLVEQVQADPKVMVGGMFLLKSMFHYREQQDIVVKTGEEKENLLSRTDIEKWFLEDGKTEAEHFEKEGQND